jgi:hypothetical protein
MKTRIVAIGLRRVVCGCSRILSYPFLSSGM